MAFRAKSHEQGRDEATGLSGVRQLIAELEKEVARSNRYGRPFCLILFHLTAPTWLVPVDGDEVVIPVSLVNQFSQLLLSLTRDTDIAARTHTNEFAALLTETERHGAMVVATRIIMALGEGTGSAQEFEMRCAIAEYPGEAGNARELWHITRVRMLKSQPMRSQSAKLNLAG
jgi:GGDEF domain-containing protein